MTPKAPNTTSGLHVPLLARQAYPVKCAAGPIVLRARGRVSRDVMPSCRQLGRALLMPDLNNISKAADVDTGACLLLACSWGTQEVALLESGTGPPTDGV